jgi:hypothetical protein
MVFYTHIVTTDHTFEGDVVSAVTLGAIIFDSYRFLVWCMILSPWGRPADDLKIFKRRKNTLI